MMRMSKADETRPSENAGMIICLRFINGLTAKGVKPPGGNQRKLSVKTSTSRVASQKLGIAPNIVARKVTKRS